MISVPERNQHKVNTWSYTERGGLSIGSSHSTECIYRGLKPTYSTHQPSVDYCNKYNYLYTGRPIAPQRFLLHCDPFSGQQLLSEADIIVQLFGLSIVSWSGWSSMIRTFALLILGQFAVTIVPLWITSFCESRYNPLFKNFPSLTILQGEFAIYIMSVNVMMLFPVWYFMTIFTCWPK